jgi:hypothetical protein
MFSPKLKFLLATTCIILFWSIVTPIFETPDEQAHFGSVEYFVKEGEMPGYDVLDMTQEMYQTQALLGILRNDQGQNKYTYHPEYRLDYSDNTLGHFETEIFSFNTFDLR